MSGRSEHVEQREFVSWFRKSYPDVRIFAIPNGGLRNKITAGKLKVEGVTAGVPDLFIPEWLVWIEMKTEGKGKVSAQQKDWKQYLEKISHQVFICYGCEAAKKVVIDLKGAPVNKR
jgi:hypothetical protein